MECGKHCANVRLRLVARRRPVVLLSFEFLESPLRVVGKDGMSRPLPPCLAEDKAVRILTRAVARLFDSYFIFDDEETPVRFDKAKQKADKVAMRALLSALRERIAECDDGSFSLRDETLRYYKKLR